MGEVPPNVCTIWAHYIKSLHCLIPSVIGLALRNLVEAMQVLVHVMVNMHAKKVAKFGLHKEVANLNCMTFKKTYLVLSLVACTDATEMTSLYSKSLSMKVVQAPPVVQTLAYTESKPDNYLVFSVLTMLFCCFICGLIALIYSLKV